MEGKNSQSIVQISASYLREIKVLDALTVLIKNKCCKCCIMLTFGVHDMVLFMYSWVPEACGYLWADSRRSQRETGQGGARRF